MERAFDVTAPDGRTLHVHETGDPQGRVVLSHHGTPGSGRHFAPHGALARERGIRLVGYDRPGYGGSSPHHGRTVADAAGDVAAILEAIGEQRFATVGGSGGGPHALACAALLGDRVVAAVEGSGTAPFGADGLDWFAGINPTGTAELRAAVAGRDALERQLVSSEYDPAMFTAADHEALAGPWGWLGRIAGEALEGGVGGMVDDDLAYVAPWGFDPADISVPVLVLHGDDDRVVPSAHGAWLAARIPSAELWLRPGQGHVSVLGAAPAALDWLLAR